MARYTDASKYDILYDLKEGEYSEKAMGGIRTRTIRAGDFLEVESYPLISISQDAKRERQKRRSSAAQEALNLKNTRKHIRRLMEANFGAGDFVLHPTYNYGFIDRGFTNMDDARAEMEAMRYPMSDDEARKVLKNFIARIKRLIKKRGGDPKQFKYIYVIETTKEPRDGDINALPARYHYHMVISGMGILTAADLQELWGFGYTKAEPVDMRFNGLEGLAKYITKQRRFTRRWARSKNLKEPDMRVSDRKISRRRAALVARDVQANAKEIFEAIYKDYELTEADVRYSDFVAGAYIYARMRRRR